MPLIEKRAYRSEKTKSFVQRKRRVVKRIEIHCSEKRLYIAHNSDHTLRRTEIIHCSEQRSHIAHNRDDSSIPGGAHCIPSSEIHRLVTAL